MPAKLTLDELGTLLLMRRFRISGNILLEDHGDVGKQSKKVRRLLQSTRQRVSQNASRKI